MCMNIYAYVNIPFNPILTYFGAFLKKKDNIQKLFICNQKKRFHMEMLSMATFVCTCIHIANEYL